MIEGSNPSALLSIRIQKFNSNSSAAICFALRECFVRLRLHLLLIQARRCAVDCFSQSIMQDVSNVYLEVLHA